MGKLASPLQAVFSSGFAVRNWQSHSAIGRVQRENQPKAAFAGRKCQGKAKALGRLAALI
ncbi:MAG: hypothetical protein FWD82_02485 [Defluviitaleaceae bacterium]|nr:hypothetical protein [Defluviitaleaceae bacterium]